MKNALSNFVNKTRTPSFRKMLGIFAFVSLIIYLLIGISSYAQWFPGSTYYFAFSTTSGKIFRILISGLVLLSSLLIFVSYYEEINRKWLIIFLTVIILSMLSVIYTSSSYYTLYKTTRLYDFMAEYFVSVSVKETLFMQASFLIDIAFGYCFIFVLPKVLSKKHLFIIFNIFLVIIFYSCIYSLLKETDYYKKFLSGDWSYSNDTVGSIFGNKQQWGIFLISAFPLCFLSIYFVTKMNLKKIFKIGIISFNILTAVLVFSLGGMSFCKTEIVSSLLFIIVFAVSAIVMCLTQKKYRKTGIILFISFVAVVFAFILAFMFVPALKQILDNILKTFETYSDESIGIRFTLVYGVFNNTPLVNAFFGMPKAITDPFVRALMPEIKNGLHTGIAIFFLRTGIFGILLFLILNILLFKKYFQLYKKHPLVTLLFISTYAVSLILNASEADILIFSSSMVGFMLNLALVCLPFVLCREELKNEKENFTISC